MLRKKRHKNKNELKLTLPKSWQELSDRQLKFAYRLIAKNCTAEDLKVRCLLKWSGIKVVGRNNGSSFLFRFMKRFFELKAIKVKEMSMSLDWLCVVPEYPVRPEKIGKHKAIVADFCEVSFETYIIIDNLFRGYLATQDETILDDAAQILYPGLKKKLKPWQRTAVFYWVASLKEYFSGRYRYFLKPASETSSGNLLGNAPIGAEEAMNAQIRALTKGDITKEKEVLALDTWRAMTELDAQAREYQQLREKSNSK